jgi:NADPH-dependent curcumin reductase CurA
MMSLPGKFRKLVVTEPGPEFRKATRVVEVDMPALQADEILVRNRFAGVNASDPVFSSGGYGHTQTPFDIGIESAGIVAAVGSGVTTPAIGDAVLGYDFGGGYAEYRVLKAAQAIPVPEASAAATSILIAGLTASIGLEVGELKSGDTVLVTAAAGSVGSYAVQLAKHAGAHVIGTCSSDDKARWLKTIGCDRAINYKREDFAAVLAAEYPQGIDLVCENVGKQMFDVAVKNLAIFGRVVCIGAVSEYEKGMAWESVDHVRIYHSLLAKSAVVRGFFLPHYPHRFPEHLQKLMTLVAEGKISAPIDPVEFRGIDSIADAVDHLHAGKNKGKVLIRF